MSTIDFPRSLNKIIKWHVAELYTDLNQVENPALFKYTWVIRRYFTSVNSLSSLGRGFIHQMLAETKADAKPII